MKSGTLLAHSKRTVASKLRRAKAAAVAERLAEDPTDFSSDQGEVWNHVDDYLRRASVKSPTAALHDVFETNESGVDDVEAALRDVKGRGAVVVVNGEIVAADGVDREETFSKLWRSLARGYALDAIVESDTGRRVGGPPSPPQHRNRVRARPCCTVVALAEG